MKQTATLLLVICLACGLCVAQVEKASKKTETTSTSNVQDNLKKMEDEWASAMLKKDRAAVDRVEANDYIFIMPNGKSRGKTEDMAALDKASYTQFTNDPDMQVRVYGDTAQVIGTTHIKGSENGQDISGSYRYIDTYVKRNGKWEAVSTMATKVPE